MARLAISASARFRSRTVPCSRSWSAASTTSSSRQKSRARLTMFAPVRFHILSARAASIEALMQMVALEDEEVRLVAVGLRRDLVFLDARHVLRADRVCDQGL